MQRNSADRSDDAAGRDGSVSDHGREARGLGLGPDTASLAQVPCPAHECAPDRAGPEGARSDRPGHDRALHRASRHPRKAGANHISIGSYNVHSCIGWDRRCSPARVAEVLRELDCDIYALQEVNNDEGEEEDSMQLEYLSRALDMAAIPGLRIVRHSGEYGNAILTHLPIESVHRHDLSYSWFEPRGALDVQLDVGLHQLRVIATHLGLSRSERRSQWRQLLTAVAEAPPEMPTIVLGDMNEWFPFSATLRDAHRILGEPLAPAAFPSFAPFLRLTRIWVRPVSSIVSLSVHRSPTARKASDHLPVKAIVDVEKLMPSPEEREAEEAIRDARRRRSVEENGV